MLRGSFFSVVRPAIPIRSHTAEKVSRPTIPRPEVGKRWGKPSSFSFSHQDPDQGGGGGMSIISESKKKNRNEIIDVTHVGSDLIGTKVEHRRDGTIGASHRQTGGISMRGSYPWYVPDNEGVLRQKGQVRIIIDLSLALHDNDSERPIAPESLGRGAAIDDESVKNKPPYTVEYV